MQALVAERVKILQEFGAAGKRFATAAVLLTSPYFLHTQGLPLPGLPFSSLAPEAWAWACAEPLATTQSF